MSIRAKILTVLFLSCSALVLLIFFTPKMLRFEVVQSEVVFQLSRELDSQVTISDLYWHWLPVPHVSVRKATIDNDQVHIDLPAARLFPNWLSLLKKEITLGKIVFIQPEIQIKSWKPYTEGSNALAALSETLIVIQNGSLRFTTENLPGNVKPHSLNFSDINATTRILPDKIEVNVNCRSPFTKSVALKGHFDVSEGSYLFSIDCKGLKLHESVTSLVEGRIVPVESEANLQGSIEGKGLQNIKASLFGELPCFTVQPQDRKLLITCGYADIAFSKSGNDYLFDIKELEIKEPATHLRGTLERNLSADGEELWHVDLKANDVNATAVREAAITLWRDNKIVQEVSGIVLGGQVKSASFFFDGPTENIKDIRNLTISADVTEASIHVPAAELILTETAGKLLIEKGLLSVENGNAKSNDSIGKNCSLLLGLTKEDHTFKLNLDLDAVVADIPPLLQRLLNDGPLKNELNNIHSATGRAVGHLSMGDHLHDVSTEVTVSQVVANATYDRLQWPVTINKGKLEILPHRVNWQQLSGAIGPHAILNSTGSIALDEDFTMDIGTLDTTLDGAAFIDEISTYPAIRKKFSQSLTSINGQLAIANFSLQGPATKPSQWKYHFDLRIDDASLSSPLLPSSVLVQNAILRITDKEVTVSECDTFFYEQFIHLNGVFSHTFLDNWRGWLGINGVIRSKLADWVKEQGWLPPLYFPRTPCTLKDLRLTWQEKDQFSLHGKIFAGDGGKDVPSVGISLYSMPQNPLKLSLDISNHNEHANLTYDSLDKDPSSYIFTWLGNLSSLTSNALLEHTELLAGRLEGNFKIRSPLLPGQALFEGDLEGSGIRWYWEFDSAYTDIDYLQLRGDGELLEIEDLLLSFQDNSEKASIQGLVSSIGNGLELNLSLTSSALSQQTVNDFLTDLGIVDKTAPEQHKDKSFYDSIKSPLNITGTVDFDLGKYTPNKRIIRVEASLAYALSSVKGRITLLPEWKIITEITSAKLCCFNLAGKWFSDPEAGEGVFTIKNDCPTSVGFENVLPCLGIKQDVIEGAFTFDADLHGEPGKWNSGKLNIQSTQGRILRMTLLSRVLSIVNLSDLLTSSDTPGSSAKGFAYSELDLSGDIVDNELVIDKAVIKGEGLNLFGSGKINLTTYETDCTIMIAPFKDIDTIISNVPLVGRAVGGENATLIAIPVGVKGDLRDPKVTVLAPSAVGEGILNLVKKTLLIPFNIISPILPKGEKDK